MLKLTSYDRAVLMMAIADGALEKVDPDKILNKINGEGQLVACSDGDQRHDMDDHLHRNGFQRRQAHLLAGGPLPLGPGSPAASLNNLFSGFLVHVTKNHKVGQLVRLVAPLLSLLGHLLRVDLFLLVQLWLGIEIKKMSTIVLMPHVPCGIARHYNLDIVQQFVMVCGAKKRLKEMFPDNSILLLLHVDWGCGRRNTYRFSKEKMSDWLAKNATKLTALKSPPQ